MAVDDDLIRKNPFGFELASVIVNDSVTREAISRKQERELLRFIKEDKHFSRYYDGIYILFHTGLRISEFCGLTIQDIEFEEMRIKVDHQLQRTSQMEYQFVTWIWDYDRTEVCHGHYYEVNFQLAKKDFAVRSGLISRAQLFAHGAVPSHRSLLGGRPGAEQRPTEGHPDRENKDRIHRPGPPGQTGAGTGAGTTNESVTHNIRRGP